MMFVVEDFLNDYRNSVLVITFPFIIIIIIIIELKVVKLKAE